MLGKGDPNPARDGRDSTERNRSWETIIGSLTASFAAKVKLGEPDATCEFQGRSFAIEAKVSYSGERLVDCIAQGFKQADRKADQSLVFVNVGRLYPVVAELRLSKIRNDPDAERVAVRMKEG